MGKARTKAPEVSRTPKHSKDQNRAKNSNNGQRSAATVCASFILQSVAKRVISNLWCEYRRLNGWRCTIIGQNVIKRDGSSHKTFNQRNFLAQGSNLTGDGLEILELSDKNNSRPFEKK